jgi:hypothetical protein
MFVKTSADDVELECSSGYTEVEISLLRRAYEDMHKHNNGVFGAIYDIILAEFINKWL